ncbi:MAG: hypothetical protein KAF42_06670 [Sphingopyxis terrae]|nr:hypothetical protein [Sphingopyxis terrae]
MQLLDLLGLFSIPGIRPPLGQHWGWWALWVLWVGFWLMLAAIIIGVLLGL